MTSSNGDGVVKGATVEYSGDRAEAARTVAAAFPGATVKESERDLGREIRVTLGTGSPDVVEVPNRLGTEPLPTPTLKSTPSSSASIQARKASDDICS